MPPAPCPLPPAPKPHTPHHLPHTLNFAPHTTFAVGGGPVSVTSGDFNGDGHLDLAVANVDSDNVSLLLGNGSGSFNPTPPLPWEAFRIPSPLETSTAMATWT
nr:VCBS repeat-containing protein [[Phormidium] sp. ETS-05]